MLKVPHRAGAGCRAARLPKWVNRVAFAARRAPGLDRYQFGIELACQMRDNFVL